MQYTPGPHAPLKSYSARTQLTWGQRRQTLQLFGASNDGFFGKPEINKESNQPWNSLNIASKLKVSKAAVSSWRKESIKIALVNTSSRMIKKYVE